MENKIIAEGKTTNEAIEKGLKQLKTSKDKVDIKVLEQEKKMFFSILDPRVVKIEMTLKEDLEKHNKEIKEKYIIELTKEEQEKAEQNVKTFIEQSIKKLEKETIYTINKTKTGLEINMTNKELGYLIGYRGEALYALQDILTAIAGRDIEKRIRVILDIENYKEKRLKTLEDLAEKVAKTVIRTRKEIKLEPMKPYERKIIHNKLQEYNNIKTKSIGDEPQRRIVISLKK